MSIELTLLSRVSYRGQEITGPRLRGLLALLAGDLRTGCGSTRLVEGIWPDGRPAKPTKALQVLVSRARAQLGPDLIASTPTGYRLTLREDQVDAAAVLALASSAARHARAGDHAAALEQAEKGLALWDGAGDGDGPLDDPVAALRAERLPAHRSLVRVRALSLARLGRCAEAVEPLTGLAAEHPRDEEVLAELLRCEAATAGPSAALARYDEYRRSLRDELGTDPGPALQAVYQRLLQGTAPAVRHGIPHEPNPLLGRAEDIAAVTGLLRTSRVTSIVGAGGLGKTRLAYAVSRQAEHRVVHFVSLAGVTSDGDVAGEVASSLGVGDSWSSPGRQAPPGDVLAGIVRALGAGSALLVLDNCEHVLGGAAELVGALVSMTRNLRVLTTSRAPLGLSSEAVHPLPELSPPTAVELFEQRARAVRPDADLPAEDVAELCRRLDGLPLAVELAAARVRVMSVAEICRRLDDRFALLRGGARDAPRRHHTLHAVVDWSWNLLDSGGQAAMRALSIFPDGFTADAARRLLGDLPEVADVLEVLEHLVDQSLLKVADTPSGTRLRMLETVREFSAARREAAGETGRALDGFLGWARDFGAAEHESVFATAVTDSSVERLRSERDNLVQALRYGLERSDDATVAATTAVLGGLWLVEGSYLRMARLAGEAVPVLARFRPGPALVDVTRTALTACVTSGFLQGPRELRSLAALRRLPQAPPDTLVRAAAVVLRALPEALRRGPTALQRLCDDDEPFLAGAANAAVSYIWEHLGDLDRALGAAERMLDASENRPHPWMLFQAHSRIAELSLLAERGERTKIHLNAALRLAEGLRPRADLDGVHLGLVAADLQCGAVDEAERWLELVQGDSDDKAGALPVMLGARAEIALARGEIAEGLRLWREAAESWRDSADPLYRSNPPGLEPWTLEVRSAAVVAHAHHGRLDLVEEVVGDLPGKLAVMLANPVAHPPAYLVELAICGAVVLALAMVELDRGMRTGDRAVMRSGARMVALAERLRYPQNFYPTMWSARARRAAEHADGPAYAGAVRAYAGLGRDELRAAAVAALRSWGR